MNTKTNSSDSVTTKQAIRVLSVGQCGFDQPRITALLNDQLGVSVDAVGSSRDALQAVDERAYALVLVNRVLDSTGESGHDLIQDIKMKNGATKVMLVSNFKEAQDQAVTIGALPGFGKDRLQDPSTVASLKAALGLL
jgi:two-component system chemotaxis response regulator CheY